MHKFLLLAAFLLTACTFKPEEDFFVNVEPNIPTVTNFQFFDEESLHMRKTITLDFRGASEDEIVGYRLYLNQTLISEGEHPYLQTIDSREYEDGVYTLKLVLVKRSNSNSLGSAVGLEFYEEEILKEATIYNGPIEPPKINFEIIDGVLTAVVEPYTGYAFKDYVVRTSETPNEVITDQNFQGQSIDDYVGGSITYSVTLHAYNEIIESSKGYQNTLNARIEKTETGLKFSWDLSPFKNWNGVRIGVLKGGAYEMHTIDKDQTEFLLDMPMTFPYNTDSYIEARNTINLGGPTLTGKGFTSTFFSYVQLADEPKKFIFTESVDSAFTVYYPNAVVSQDKLIRYSAQSQEVTRTTGTYCLSPDRKNIFEFRNNRIYNINPTTLQSVDELDIVAAVGTYTQFLQIHATNSKFVMIYVAKGSEKWYYTFDWSSKTVLFSGTTKTDYPLHKNGQLSDDGTLFYNTPQAYYLELISPNKVRGYSNTATVIGSTKKIASYYDSKLTLIGCNPAMAVVNEIAYPKNVRSVFSNQTGQVAVAYAESGVIKIDFFNSETLDYIKTLPTQLHPSGTYFFELAENKLVVKSSGFSFLEHYKTEIAF